MNKDTINADVTMDGAAGTLLAGRYRVIRQLGQGGMGSVWLAEDVKLDGYRVAVKMLPSVLFANKRAYDQLKAEALVSLKLTHPNIATVRAFEENGGNPFLVIDYIDGETLDDLLAEKGTLSEAETIRILSPVAAALDYAHRQGVVHRDVKPGNVMIAKDGTPYVLDFGIAREIQETMTRVTGKLSSGTLLYMSPEQLSGAAPKPAQDVYSFAAMAYECLKGSAPFCRGQVEYQILNEEPEPLSGGSLSRSVMRGLSKNPAARPPDCRSVLCAARRPSANAAREPSRAMGGRAKSNWNDGGVERFRRALVARLAPFLALPWAKPTLAVVTAGLLLVISLCWRTSVVARMHKERQDQRRMAEIEQQLEVQEAVITRRVEEERRRRQAEELAKQNEAERKRQAEEAGKASVEDVLGEAKDRLAQVKKLGGLDGVDRLIADCEGKYEQADALCRSLRWREAAQAYTNVLETCKKIVALEGARSEMAVEQSKMFAACEAARRAGAERLAKNTFALAREFQSKGDRARLDMRFKDAERSYRTATERYSRAKMSSEAAAGRLAKGEFEAKKLNSLMSEVSRLDERKVAAARIVGIWTSRYCHIVKLSGSAPSKIVFVETLQIKENGSYRQEIQNLTQAKMTVESGRWNQNGAALTLRPDTGDSRGEAESHELLWADRDRFEMRLSAYEIGRRLARRSGTVKCLSCYYDSVGVLTEKKSDSRFSNGVYTVQVTPKWYERDESQ